MSEVYVPVSGILNNLSDSAFVGSSLTKFSAPLSSLQQLGLPSSTGTATVGGVNNVSIYMSTTEG